MAKILLASLLALGVINFINGLTLASRWRPELSVERVKYIGNSLRPGRPLKRNSFENFMDTNTMDFNKFGNDETIVEFLPTYDVWRLPKPIYSRDLYR